MKNLMSGLVLVVLFTIATQITACSSGDDSILDSNDSESLQKVEDFEALESNDLSDTEKASLIFMREEEKLARDVYLSSKDKYNLRVFNNISKSEQAHMNAIKTLLDRYEIEDPIVEDIRGSFKNPELQALYVALIDKSGISITEALEAGAMIEEIDILDLRESIAMVDNSWAITKVYTNLEKASQAHLRAFVFNLKVRGVTYAPKYLDQVSFDEIINK